MKQVFCGGGENRTPVRINSSVSVYMFRLYSESYPMIMNSHSLIGPAYSPEGCLANTARRRVEAVYFK